MKAMITEYQHGKIRDALAKHHRKPVLRKDMLWYILFLIEDSKTPLGPTVRELHKGLHVIYGVKLSKQGNKKIFPAERTVQHWIYKARDRGWVEGNEYGTGNPFGKFYHPKHWTITAEGSRLLRDYEKCLDYFYNNVDIARDINLHREPAPVITDYKHLLL